MKNEWRDTYYVQQIDHIGKFHPSKDVSQNSRPLSFSIIYFLPTFIENMTKIGITFNHLNRIRSYLDQMKDWRRPPSPVGTFFFNLLHERKTICVPKSIFLAFSYFLSWCPSNAHSFIKMGSHVWARFTKSQVQT